MPYSTIPQDAVELVGVHAEQFVFRFRCYDRREIIRRIFEISPSRPVPLNIRRHVSSLGADGAGLFLRGFQIHLGARSLIVRITLRVILSRGNMNDCHTRLTGRLEYGGHTPRKLRNAPSHVLLSLPHEHLWRVFAPFGSARKTHVPEVHQNKRHFVERNRAIPPRPSQYAERRFLAAALPDNVVQPLCRLFPSGVPAPYSVEISGLASMTAFAAGPGTRHKGDTIAVVDFGASCTYAAFYSKGIISLVRRFDFGAEPILRKLQESLGVDGDVTLGILNDQSFDVSQTLRQAMEPFLQQMTISIDFVESRENTPVSELYVGGGFTLFQGWIKAVQEGTGRHPILWNPFESIKIGNGSIPPAWQGQESRFAAATGAALAALSI